MQLSINTDYKDDISFSETFLQRIAEVGFTNVHWCHHWKGDYIYSDYEIEEIRKWLERYKLSMADCHATDGEEKSYCSPVEYKRKAGIDLIKNRIHFINELGGNVIVLHLWTPDDFLKVKEVRNRFLKIVFRSFDELMEYALQKKVKIGIENLEYNTNNEIDMLWGTLFDRYGCEYMGLCYDSGHGINSDADTLDLLEKYKQRIVALHLNENNGLFDLHQIPFTTNLVNWEKLASILARSPYEGPITLEVNIKNSISHHRRKNDEIFFLKRCFDTAKKIEQMVIEKRKESS